MTYLRDGQTWLSALQNHRIFYASPASALSPSTSLIPPSSPDASSIHGVDFEIGIAGSSLVDTTDGTPTKLARRILNDQTADRTGFRTACIIGGTDIVVAISSASQHSLHSDEEHLLGSGSYHGDGCRQPNHKTELRIASLSQFKTQYETSNDKKDRSQPVPSYKTLLVPEIDFAIVELVPAPSNRHLAVIGLYQIVVVELPRKGWEGLVNPTLECSAIVIGKYHHTFSAPNIVKARWHPLALQYTSLVILTADGLLREYDVIDNPDEPVQELACVPYSLSRTDAATRASHTMFTPDDEDDHAATSFAFGQDDYAWGSMTVYCLTRSGDVFAVCPFLPKSSHLPMQLVPTLIELTETKLYFLDSAAAARDLSAVDRRLLQQQYEAQLHWLKALNQCAIPSTRPEASQALRMTLRQKNSSLRRKPSPQGPFLLQPAPHELSWSDECVADDLLYVKSTVSEDNPITREMGIILVAYSNGKLDAYLDVQTIEPVWQAAPRNALPCLLVAQTLDLLGEEIHASVSAAQYGRTLLTTDSDDPAVVWCESNGHTISLNVNRPLISPAQDLHIVQARTVIKSQNNAASTVGLPNTPAALLVLHDVYLGNALLKVADSSITSCTLDIHLTVPDQSKGLGVVPFNSSADLLKGPPSYQAFEGTAPFALPNTILDVHSSPRGLALSGGDISARNLVDARGQLTLSLQTLKAVGQVTDKLDDTVRSLIAAGNAVQERLELHMKELPRQVGKYQVLDERIQLLSEVLEDDCNPRLATLMAEQNHLEHRADLLLRRVIDLNQPDMSAAEQAWADELKRVSRAVQSDKSSRGFSSSIAQRSQRAEEQFDVIRHIPSHSNKVRASMSLGQQQKAQIYLILGQHNQELAETKAAVEAMSSKLAEMRQIETHKL